MAAVVESKTKKRGREITNSMMEKSKVTTRRAPAFSLLIKRRTMAPTNGKKVKKDRMGMPRISITSAPFHCLYHQPAINSKYEYRNPCLRRSGFAQAGA